LIDRRQAQALRPLVAQEEKGGRTGTREEIAQRGLQPGTFRVDSPAGRRAFQDGLRKTTQEDPFGAAVEVKEPAFYEDPNTKLFLSEDRRGH